MCTNFIETVILKSHRISKSCYHVGDLEGKDICRLMAKGIVVFEEIRRCLRANKLNNVKEDDINQLCNNFSRLKSLMDSIFSTLHSKRKEFTIDKINTLKEDLNLVRLK